jgi:DNA invertase Pin-like site-specific DNA recombinase
MKDAIGYLRVSTREQGRSGLGLAAQRFEIETFRKREGFRVINAGVARTVPASWPTG